MKKIAYVLFLWMLCTGIEAQELPTVDYTQLEKELDEIDTSHTVLINFWATWCAPCVAELPYFKKITEQKPDLVAVFVSLDFPDQKESTLIPFILENNLPGRHFLLDDPAAHDWVDKVDSRWSGALPATLLLKKQQKYFHEGKFNTYEELEAFLEGS